MGTTRFTTCPIGVVLIIGFSGVNVFVILTGVSCKTPFPNCKTIFESLVILLGRSSLPVQMTGSFPQLPTTTLLYSLLAASMSGKASMDSPLHPPASVKTASASIKDMPRSSVLFHATIDESEYES